jgi:hypothetical protein
MVTALGSCVKWPSYCKNPKIRPTDPSHWRSTFKARHSPKCLCGSTFSSRQWTLERSLGQMGMKTQTRVERLLIFYIKRIKFDKISAVRLEGLFWTWNKVGGSFFLWSLDLAVADFHIVPNLRLQFLYFIGNLFSAHFFGLSTKFGHSIPRQPLDSDGHSVKRP